MEETSPFQSFLEADKRLMFLFICLYTLALLFVKKSFIENETAAFEFLANRPEGSILVVRSTVQYLSIPLIYLWKFVILAFLVWVGCFMFGYRVLYSQCWRIVTAAELIFIIPEVLKIGWFMLVPQDPDFFEIQAFYPLSVLQMTDYREVSDRWHYPLKALNLFEFAYCYLLALGVHFYSRKPVVKGLLVIACTYLPVFLLWLGFYTLVYD